MKYTVFSLFLLIVILISCKPKKSTNINSVSDLSKGKCMEDGKEITSSSFIALSSALSSAVKKGGLENALSFCNVNALPLTDSLSKAYNVDIKRTSLKYRNVNNKPNIEEEEILKKYSQAIDNNEVLRPICTGNNDSKMFYAPIIIQDACLKCHGDKSSIAVYDQILDLYPRDMATGYNRGDLRGMWSVTFKK